jgi:hypothetical protein
MASISLMVRDLEDGEAMTEGHDPIAEEALVASCLAMIRAKANNPKTVMITVEVKVRVWQRVELPAKPT